jgi:hypothetical protein
LLASVQRIRSRWDCENGPIILLSHVSLCKCSNEACPMKVSIIGYSIATGWYMGEGW